MTDSVRSAEQDSTKVRSSDHPEAAAIPQATEEFDFAAAVAGIFALPHLGCREGRSREAVAGDSIKEG